MGKLSHREIVTCPFILISPWDVYVQLSFNRSKLLTKIHDGEVRSQSYQVSDWLFLPASLVLLVWMKSLVQSADTLLCVTDCHNHHWGPPTGGRKHWPSCDHWGRGWEEAKHSEGRNQQPILQWSKSWGSPIPSPSTLSPLPLSSFLSQIESLCPHHCFPSLI